MSIKYAIDNCIDDREFRNIIYCNLYKRGLKTLKIDDVRLSDDDIVNDNDMHVKDKKIRVCTVQTFLNEQITDKEINETKEDMKKENVNHGVIITNCEVSLLTQIKAWFKNITIHDNKSDIIKEIEEYNKKESQ